MSSLSCRLTGNDWMRAFISHLLQMSHSQWIFRNYTLHDKQRGYLCLRLRSDILREIQELLETPLSGVPLESRYLLELDHSSMYNAMYKEQTYWVLAIKAARRAGQRTVVTRANPKTATSYLCLGQRRLKQTFAETRLRDKLLSQIC
jgi:hypothetical protein